MLRRLVISSRTPQILVRKPVPSRNFAAAVSSVTTTSSQWSIENNTNLNGSASSSRQKVALALGAALGLGLAASYQQQTKTDCCGIAAVVGTSSVADQDSRDFLLEGLTALKNRGYDSAGMATIPATGGSMVSSDAVI